jgi:Rod binding domain-containing protein
MGGQVLSAAATPYAKLANPLSSVGVSKAGAAPASSAQAKAAAAATNFEAVFLNSMFQQMFTGMDGEGPFGGGAGTGVWRSFLSDEYAKSFASKGGIGIGKEVYRSLLAIQEAASK